MKRKNLGIYIHIPFCTRRCNYCDFASSIYNKEKSEEYVNNLIFEIEQFEYKDSYIVDSIFIGGGTPSVLELELIYKIINSLNKNFYLSNCMEISIESNPASLTKDKIKTYYNLSINRLSIGIQSFNDVLLRRLGRIHNFQEAIRCIENIKNSHFKNYNIDLIYSIPGMRFSDLKESLKYVSKYDVKHVSFYSLIVEDNTKIKELFDKKILFKPYEDVDCFFTRTIKSELEEIGFHQYEISNYAKASFECRHNLKYWNLEEYIGFGLSAHSMIKNKRLSNPSSFKDYYSSVKNNKRILEEELKEKDLISEYIIFKLRTNAGIDLSEFKNRFGVDIFDIFSEKIKKNIQEKNLTIDRNSLKYTNKGRNISNIIELNFI